MFAFSLKNLELNNFLRKNLPYEKTKGPAKKRTKWEKKKKRVLVSTKSAFDTRAFAYENCNFKSNCEKCITLGMHFLKV